MIYLCFKIKDRNFYRLNYSRGIPCLNYLFISALYYLKSNSSSAARLIISIAEKINPVMRIGGKDLNGTIFTNYIREVNGHLITFKVKILAQYPRHTPI